ncbi:MAG TPA: hypothetical protein VK178_12165 [Opitutaceae bacterium]|nr:hypothetical protein [Opitutaceae bacterium]
MERELYICRRMQKTSFPEASPNPWAFTRLSFKAGLPVGLALLLEYCAMDLFARRPPGAALAIALMVVVLVLGGVGVHYWCRWLDGLDELQRQIQLKSLALTVPFVLGLALAYEVLRRGGLLAGWQLSVVDACAALLVVYGLLSGWFWWRNR